MMDCVHGLAPNVEQYTSPQARTVSTPRRARSQRRASCLTAQPPRAGRRLACPCAVLRVPSASARASARPAGKASPHIHLPSPPRPERSASPPARQCAAQVTDALLMESPRARHAPGAAAPTREIKCTRRLGVELLCGCAVDQIHEVRERLGTLARRLHVVNAFRKLLLHRGDARAQHLQLLV